MESMTEPVESTAESSVVASDDPAEPAEQALPPADLAAVLKGAAEQARAVLVEFSGEETVGEYLGAGFEDPTSATHRFLANLPGYRGWQWAVVVAAYPGAEQATVSEVVLVPGPTALLAPRWVPWEDRVKPGDLSPGDLLAPPSEDPRLVPGYVASGDPELDEVAAEVGFGRRQVLSDWGRTGAAERWHDGDFGPGSAMARATKRTCRDCGFYLPLAGALGPLFGVCANEMAADGHVVDSEYGCGAHSDTPAPAGTGSPLYDPYDDGVLEVLQAPPPPADPTPVPPADPTPEPPEEPIADPTSDTTSDTTDEPAAEQVSDSADVVTAEPVDAATAETTEEPTAETTDAATAETTDAATAETTDAATAETTEEPTN